MARSIYRKKLIAFDKDVLKRIERERKLQNLDFTKFVRKAVQKYILSLEFERAKEDAERG